MNKYKVIKAVLESLPEDKKLIKKIAYGEGNVKEKARLIAEQLDDGLAVRFKSLDYNSKKVIIMALRKKLKA